MYGIEISNAHALYYWMMKYKDWSDAKLNALKFTKCYFRNGSRIIATSKHILPRRLKSQRAIQTFISHTLCKVIGNLVWPLSWWQEELGMCYLTMVHLSCYQTTSTFHYGYISIVRLAQNFKGRGRQLKHWLILDRGTNLYRWAVGRSQILQMGVVVVGSLKAWM